MSDVLLFWLVVSGVVLLPIAGWSSFVKLAKLRASKARNCYFRKTYFRDLEDTLSEYQQCQAVDVLPRMTLSSALLYMLGLMDFHFAARKHERVRINAIVLRRALKDAERAQAADFPSQMAKLGLAFSTLKESADRYMK